MVSFQKKRGRTSLYLFWLVLLWRHFCHINQVSSRSILFDCTLCFVCTYCFSTFKISIFWLYNVPSAPVDWILHRVGRTNAAQTSHHFVTTWNYQLAIAKLLCSQLFFRVFICTFNWGCQSVNAVSLSSFYSCLSINVPCVSWFLTGFSTSKLVSSE